MNEACYSIIMDTPEGCEPCNYIVRDNVIRLLLLNDIKYKGELLWKR